MEDLYGRFNDSGENLFTSSSTRFKPSRSAFEDLGTSFKPSQGKGGTPCKSTKSASRSRDGSDSEDEMDCFSQSTQADEKEVLNKSRKSEYDVAHLEKKHNALKNIKFKKTKQTNVEDENAPCIQAKSDTQKTRLKASKTDSDLVKGRNRTSAIRKTNTLSSLENPSPSVPRPRPRPTRSNIRQPSSKLGEQTNPTIPEEQRNKLSVSSFPLPSPLSTQKNALRGTPGRARSSSGSGNDSHSSRSSLPIHSTITKPTTNAIKAFPAFSPLSSPINVKMKAEAKAFPPLSPLTTERKSNSRNKGKSKAILQPFPLSTQDFAGVTFSSTTYSDEGDSAMELDLTKRKFQNLESESINDHMDLYEEEDSMFLTAGVDPNTLCPFCDTPLPSFPTPVLKRLLENAKKNSRPNPRPSNALGRKATLSVFVAVCQRHQFELKILPEAEKNGWPKDINWEDLSERTKRLKVHLRAIIDDPEIQEDYSDDWGSYVSEGPKARCTFWREAVKAIKARGMRDVTGIRGQFQDFDKAQPGYYGEMGSLIIQQTLMNMFPPGSLDSSLITPFTPNEFIQRILVPEVALRLIMDDQGLKGVTGAETALQVLRDSSAYGLSMFPEGDRDVDELDVGDRMMMEMARKRRKEIEQEAVSGASIETPEIFEAEVKVDKRRKCGEINPRKAGGTDSEAHERAQRHRPNPRKPRNRETKNGIISLSESQSESEIYNPTASDKTISTSRPRRNRTAVKYKDISSDEDSSSQTRNRLRKHSKVPSRSPSLGIFCSSSPQQEKSKAFSDMDISSGAENTDKPGMTAARNSPASTPIVKQRPRPHPLFNGDNDATPRPVAKAGPLRPQESILARARDRRSTKAKEATEDHQNSASTDPWLHNMRAHIPDDSSDSDDNSVLTQPSKAQHKRGQENHSWLLSDPPSSQETTAAKPRYHRK